MLIGIILLVILFAFGFNLVMLLYLTGLMNVSMICVCVIAKFKTFMLMTCAAA